MIILSFWERGGSLVLRPASGVVGLERCVEAGHDLSVTFEALREAGAIKPAWLLRARGDTSLRLIEVGEDGMAHELWIEPQNLHAVRIELCNDLGLGAEQESVVSRDCFQRRSLALRWIPTTATQAAK